MNGSNNSSIIKSRHKVPSCLVRLALKGMTDKKIGLAGTQRRSIPSHETKCCIWKSLRGKVHVLKKYLKYLVVLSLHRILADFGTEIYLGGSPL